MGEEEGGTFVDAYNRLTNKKNSVGVGGWMGGWVGGTFVDAWTEVGRVSSEGNVQLL